MTEAAIKRHYTRRFYQVIVAWPPRDFSHRPINIRMPMRFGQRRRFAVTITIRRFSCKERNAHNRCQHRLDTYVRLRLPRCHTPTYFSVFRSLPFLLYASQTHHNSFAYWQERHSFLGPLRPWVIGKK